MGVSNFIDEEKRELMMKKIFKIFKTALVAVCLFAAIHPGLSAPVRTYELTNAAFQLTVRTDGEGVDAGLLMRSAGLRAADGPYLYRAERVGPQSSTVQRGLQNAAVATTRDSLTIRGTLAGLEVEHTFTAPPDKPFMEERLRLRNPSGAVIQLRDFEAGFQRQVADTNGHVLAGLAQDRWVAVPFRSRATDPKGHVDDFAISDLVTQPGYEPRVSGRIEYTQVPSPHRASEGWAWVHGDRALGIFTFNQTNMLFSVVSAQRGKAGDSLRFGGACMISGEPSALGRIAPGESVDLGTVRYQAIAGGYVETAYAFRAMLDEKGCHFPKKYNPPIHWEQLYDMEGAWDDRLHKYTKAILESEAQKGVAYSCEALYLDPGWDTAFGTFLWGEEWLGPRRQFIKEMRSKFGLQVALHCPLATWVGLWTMGPPGWESWPRESWRSPPPAEEELRVLNLQSPALRGGRRNLALLPEARAKASSALTGYAFHKIEHLNDGWLGNRASWIAGKLPAWAEIDLGGVYRIAEVRLGNDHAAEFSDRAATQLRILVATNYTADSIAPSWQTVAEHDGQPLLTEKTFSFAPVQARWVRVEIFQSKGDLPRLDEVEIYDAEATAAAIGEAFAKNARRGPEPAPQVSGSRLCLGARQYLDEAEKRLLANCADGAAFLMFDGNWWNGGCVSLDHGHPVPYEKEDHIRANLDLAQRVHAKYPKVLIEMHDTIAGGSPARVTPVYYKYGLPGSYDENWGFELMWNPMDDLKQGRARALYYYNLGCNVPVYLHIDLRKDNEECVVLWWYASTCRHLGIGGTHANPAVVAAQKRVMQMYRALDRFYKRGEFYGLGEEIHLHVLPSENAFVVNVFNLSDQPRTLTGGVELAKLGVDSKRTYFSQDQLGVVRNGQFKLDIEMPPWSARMGYFSTDVNERHRRPPPRSVKP